MKKKKRIKREKKTFKFDMYLVRLLHFQKLPFVSQCRQNPYIQNLCPLRVGPLHPPIISQHNTYPHTHTKETFHGSYMLLKISSHVYFSIPIFEEINY